MEWSTDFPDWKEDGKQMMSLLTEEGSIVTGTLYCEDVDKDEHDDEFPIWKVLLASGDERSLIDFKGWVFVRPAGDSLISTAERNFRDFGMLPVPQQRKPVS